jgi:hypothetical protein
MDRRGVCPVSSCGLTIRTKAWLSIEGVTSRRDEGAREVTGSATRMNAVMPARLPHRIPELLATLNAINTGFSFPVIVDIFREHAFNR